jgi:hypothetical protein
MSNINNGMITKIWGPALWTGLHIISFGYPVEPSEEQKEWYKIFFTNVGHVLPCKYCRDSYNTYLKEPDTELNEHTLKNRDTLTRWLYDLHNKINDKLGIKYNITYECIVKKYETYRAECINTTLTTGCVIPVKKAEICYSEATKKECPYIDYKIGQIFKYLAIERQIKPKYFYYWNIIEKNNGIIKKDNIWDKRNKYCAKIINHIRKHNIPSIEQSGIYQGLPSLFELKLILCLCTTICKNDLEKCIDKYKIK